MRFWTFIKLICALVVAMIAAATTLFTMHVMGKPIPAPFPQLMAQWIPEPQQFLPGSSVPAEQLLEGKEMVHIDPGDKAFQKAAELLATGKIPEARDKLTFLLHYYPSSSATPRARQILGEMNMDTYLSPIGNTLLIKHTVTKGDSYLKIAKKYETSIDGLLHFNNFLDLRPLQPGDLLWVMPLNLHVTIEAKRQALTLWKGNDFLKEYRLLACHNPPTAVINGSIDSKIGYTQGKKIQPGSRDYRAADKALTISKIWNLLPYPEDGALSLKGFYVHRVDAEELALLLRIGNEVEIRP